MGFAQGVENMDTKLITELLYKKIPKENILQNQLMKNYTTFKVGGPVDVLVKPQSIEEISFAVKTCTENQIPFYCIGNGSNLLVDDKGFQGVIIQIYKGISEIVIQDNIITAGAGALLSRVASKALDTELTGFEFAHGIPGTLGGAVVMNAGAYGGEIKDVIVSAKVMNAQGEIFELDRDALEMGYRTSKVAREGLIVLEATIRLEKGKREAILALMKDYNGRRREKQPLDKPSAGSTFKRPISKEDGVQLYAGKLIQDAGLRGYRVGDAAVSEKHCGFVVNEGSATFEELMQLITHVQEEVKTKFGVDLETEVKIIKN